MIIQIRISTQHLSESGVYFISFFFGGEGGGGAKNECGKMPFVHISILSATNTWVLK